MAYFRECINRGPLPEAAGQAPLDVATQLRETVLQASLYMTMRQAQGGPGQLDSRAGELWDR